MKIETRIKQSAVRVKSGYKLVGFLLLLTAIFAVIHLAWAAKICLALAIFFIVVTLIEFLNVKRLEKQKSA